MIMVHHSTQPYAEAASAAAAKARVKMQEMIHAGLASAEKVIETVQNSVIKDAIVKAPTIRLATAADKKGWRLEQRATGSGMPLHPFAYNQVLLRAEIPAKFRDFLEEKGDWGREELAQTVNNIYEHSADRHLVRQSDGMVKGFLSDQFRRIDSRPLLDAFIKGCQELQLVPVQGFAQDTKVSMRAVLPKVFEPIPNEVQLFGLSWSNSDYGNGGHQVNLYILRLWCTNLAMREECLRQVHLGKRLDDNIQYSENTYQLDTQANAAALRDVVAHAMSPARINAHLELVREAANDKIDGREGVLGILKRKKLDKQTAERIADIFDSPDVENLPEGSSMYRLSNSVSWLAQAKNISTDKRLDLEVLAGDLLPEVKGFKAVSV